MAAKAIREVQSLGLVSKHLDVSNSGGAKILNFASIESEEDLETLPESHPWINEGTVVVKSDQLIKRRAKSGLIAVNVDWSQAKEFVQKYINKEFTLGNTTGKLKTFIVVPFVPHKQEEEFYLCIHSLRGYDEILFTTEGGIEIGDVESKARIIKVRVESDGIDPDQLENVLLEKVSALKKSRLASFINSLYSVYRKQYFTYLEINPLVVTDSAIYILDLAAKVDSAADYLVPEDRKNLDYPAPFGRDATPEEAKIADLDGKTGASLKLTILNEAGRIWTMVAGGGASVIFADTIVEKSGVAELANYGEYSGAPNEGQTYEYAKTIIDLMCRHPHPDGKILIIGGGIANFTNVADTLKGIIRAIKGDQDRLKEHNTKIYVRRGGPNYKEGLRLMKNLGAETGLPIQVFGPEINMTAIVGMALGEDENEADAEVHLTDAQIEQVPVGDPSKPLFTRSTRSIIFGRQFNAAQLMLDYDRACGRETPSVACIVDPFTSTSRQALFWGTTPHYIPIYSNTEEAVKKHPEVDVMVNFASFRSAYDVTIDAMRFPNLKTIAIIAEGIPENLTRKLIVAAKEKHVNIIGPATVGGIKPGCFRIGNTGGAMDNIVSSKLYRPGSVAYVSRSGGMSNELNNIIARNTNGVYEGVAIGGDRYPGTIFMDHLLRYQDDPAVKMLVLLGEVGGVEEYSVCEALKSGRINKPMVAWCIGTCGDMFTTDVQFGHAGASASGDAEKATVKNQALAKAGAIVPRSFQELDMKIQAVYNGLVEAGVIKPFQALAKAGAIVPRSFQELDMKIQAVYNGLVEAEVIKPFQEPAEPKIPMDFASAQKAGLIRRPATFLCSVSDDRGEEVTYGGIPISKIVQSGKGIGKVLGLLWFQKDNLPDYFYQFLELGVILTADHGPAVSGAHNTIIAARAGKDLVSSLVSGLLTIGPRFGGALNDAAEQFSGAFDRNWSPTEFVAQMKKRNEYIMGIGHRIKSVENPDSRVTIIKDFVDKNFPTHPLFSYALEVERVTTQKRNNLILNVDGAIAVAFVDLLRQCDQFSKEEADNYIKMGILNAIFVFGRSAGLIGHYIDQLRLDQPLYRTPWDDIAYLKLDN